jgi:hypothetical protein
VPFHLVHDEREQEIENKKRKRINRKKKGNKRKTIRETMKGSRREIKEDGRK